VPRKTVGPELDEETGGWRRLHNEGLNVFFSSQTPPPPLAQQPLVGQSVLITEASRSHSGIPHSVGLLWTSDQPHVQTIFMHNTQHSQETDIHASGGFRTHDPSTCPAADPRCRPIGYQGRPSDRVLARNTPHLPHVHGYNYIRKFDSLTAWKTYAQMGIILK